ncbi:nicotinamide/nicotinic acid mononucleotide adenylyltransferase 1-like isoform X1 [Argiope bruennichi]|uniref:nicotinamide/nicotinic acid mononucleotide adenylyltransferase 1-like isoform X1 n=1 Tax=Argiope bruennichi TaxID=94029 RepID=UPI0024953DD0|nr:nicotinamide/nicotinic acid mononucleotide adenylyltransferase 1-like isoform X1 [Argiope bruennichi]
MSSAINIKTRIILLSCGSFNPITHMHLRLFELARDYLHSTGRFQVVGGIISPVNDEYKKKDLISAKHRCEMVELALKSNDWVKLDCWESDQESWTPTVKVLEYHQNILNSITNANNIQMSASKKQKLDVENMNAVNNNGQSKDWDLSQPVHLMLLCGGDLLESFNVPDLWASADIARIVGKFGLAVVTRSGSNPQRFVYESDILSKFQNNIHIITEWIPNDISSTSIRRAIRRGNSVKYLIPDAVFHYIKEHGLYSSNNKYHVTFPELTDANYAFIKNLCDDIYLESEQETAV